MQIEHYSNEINSTWLPLMYKYPKLIFTYKIDFAFFSLVTFVNINETHFNYFYNLHLHLFFYSVL